MDTSGIFVKNELPIELSEKEVNDLLKKIRGNDQLAKEKLILHCTGFTVRYVTKKYGHRSDKKEILSRALTGVVKGVNKYDYKKSDNFMAFVYVCFTNEIKMYFNKLNKLKYHEMLLMDEPISDDKKNHVIDTINSGVNIEKTYEKKELYNRIRELVDSLGKKNSEIVKLYYGFNNLKRHTQYELADMYGITQSRVNKIIKESVTFISNTLKKEGLIVVKENKPPIKKKKIKTSCFYNLFAFDEKIVWRIFNLLNDEEKTIIYKKYGDKLDGSNVTFTTTYEDDKLYKVIIPKIRRMYEYYCVNKKILVMNINDQLFNEIMFNLKSNYYPFVNLSFNESIIYSLYIGYLSDVLITPMAISTYLKMDLNEVKKILSRTKKKIDIGKNDKPCQLLLTT